MMTGSEYRRYMYRCERRGRRELDILLGWWAREHLLGLGDDELVHLDLVLALDDTDLWNFFCGDEGVAQSLRQQLTLEAYGLLEEMSLSFRGFRGFGSV
ncbi:MAG: succinate dehydrogenase assembly factor 2 [Alphaproteobacteria bacterium]